MMEFPPNLFTPASHAAAASTSTTRAPTLAEIEKSMAELAAFGARCCALRPYQSDFIAGLGVRVQIIPEDFLPRDPRRVHKRRRWDRGGKYHARIQKKWNKRFGVDVCQAAYVSDAGKTLYVTLKMLNRLRDDIA